jgi:hypothetical protein
MLGRMTDGQIWRQLIVEEAMAGGDFSSWRLPSHPNTDDPAVIEEFKRRYRARRNAIVAAARERMRVAAEQERNRHNCYLIGAECGVPAAWLLEAFPQDAPLNVSKAELERYFERCGYFDPRTPRPWPGYKSWSFPDPPG